MRAGRLLAIWMCAALTGCALNPPPPATEIRSEALPHFEAPTRWSVPTSRDGAVTDSWLATFADPGLAALVGEALTYNADLRLAASRVDVAAAYLNAANAPLWPQVNLIARGGGKMGGDSSGLQGIGLFASWELDLWGRVRAVSRYTEIQYESAKLDAEYARQSIAALVAKGWILAVEARLQIAQADAMRKTAEQLAFLANDRLRVGIGDEYEVAVAQANAESFRDTVRNLELSYQSALRALEALVGRYPGATVSVALQLPSWPGDVPAGLPSELLERRPDVVAAERRVAAAFYRTEEAKAARLPRITLIANLTTISSEMFVLQNRDNPVGSVGAALLQPIFIGGLLQAQVDARTAEQKSAVIEYGRVGARVFGEVENALSAGFAAMEREQILQRAVRENERALELANVRYHVGSIDLRGVQQQQLTLYSARVALLRMQSERLVQRVNLHLALGGSFDPAPLPATKTSDASAATR